jgi:hypothetical protein
VERPIHATLSVSAAAHAGQPPQSPIAKHILAPAQNMWGIKGTVVESQPILHASVATVTSGNPGIHAGLASRVNTQTTDLHPINTAAIHSVLSDFSDCRFYYVF